MRRQVPPKRLFLQEPHSATTEKTPFFIVIAVKTSNLTLIKGINHSNKPVNMYEVILTDTEYHRILVYKSK
jgi:hypothetical protein